MLRGRSIATLRFQGGRDDGIHDLLFGKAGMRKLSKEATRFGHGKRHQPLQREAMRGVRSADCERQMRARITGSSPKSLSSQPW